MQCHDRYGNLLATVKRAFFPLLLAGSSFAQAPTLPPFTLPDCIGRSYTQVAALSNGAVLVITTPTHAQGSAQSGWDRVLGPLGWPDLGPFYAYVQDLSQSWFGKIAVAEMRRKYDPPPLLLVDRDGKVRESLGFPPGVTWVAVYAPGGRLALVEHGGPTPERAKAIWSLAFKLLEEHRAGQNAVHPGAAP